jgi:hypothetical protein
MPSEFVPQAVSQICWVLSQPEQPRQEARMPKKQSRTTKQSKATKSAMTKSSAKEFLAGYEEFLHDLKTRIRSTQIKAAIAVNSEMISFCKFFGDESGLT